jgi:V/A-type H+-transporting ATPase subunit I
VLSVGILLHAVETCWQGKGGSEGVADAAQLVVYWGVLLALLDPRFAWLCAIGAILCITNRLWRERSALALLAGIGHQVESTFSLLLNTLSFARLGAFALAHAALETAIIAIADEVPSAAAAVVIVTLGNLLVILLEGVVVSVQTTRLVLFEFFARFFEGKGRQFRPVALPPAGRDDRTR